MKQQVPPPQNIKCWKCFLSLVTALVDCINATVFKHYALYSAWRISYEKCLISKLLYIFLPKRLEIVEGEHSLRNSDTSRCNGKHKATNALFFWAEKGTTKDFFSNKTRTCFYIPCRELTEHERSIKSFWCGSLFQPWKELVQSAKPLLFVRQ